MLKTDWALKAEFRIEAIRKAAENELQAIKRDFPHWPQDDARRCAIMRLASMLFVPVVSLYVMRIHMADPAWWEQYSQGAGNDLADPGRTAFGRGIKGNLIIDLVGNSEHSFRLILNQLDPTNEASKFATICEGLFRTTTPHLSKVPDDWEPTIKLLRLMRNTIHTAWAYFPDNGKNATVIFKGTKYDFIVGKPLNFVSWDLLGEISESLFHILIAVVRDANVILLPTIKDFGVEEAPPAAHTTTP
jgi:hypothetical protein